VETSVDRLRHDIDRGLGGDKVRVVDPAAAPLGTDDEAAGRPVSPRRVRLARWHEIQRAVRNDAWFAAGAVHAGVIAVWALAFTLAVLLA